MMCREGIAAAYLIQIVNEPSSVAISKDRHASKILWPVDGVVELIAKAGRRFVDAMDLLQDWVGGRIHDGDRRAEKRVAEVMESYI